MIMHSSYSYCTSFLIGATVIPLYWNSRGLRFHFEDNPYDSLPIINQVELARYIMYRFGS